MKHDNGEQEFRAPHLIVTPKGVTHQFIALEENTVFCCIHALRAADGEIIPPDADPFTVEQYIEHLTHKV